MLRRRGGGDQLAVRIADFYFAPGLVGQLLRKLSSLILAVEVQQENRCRLDGCLVHGSEPLLWRLQSGGVGPIFQMGSGVGLPSFYVSVIFHDLPTDSFFIAASR